MNNNQQNKTLYSAIELDQAAILKEWIAEQKSLLGQYGAVKEQELTEQCQSFLEQFVQATREGNLTNMQSPQWRATYAVLEEVAIKRGELGLSPSETATFVFSFKRPLFAALARITDGNATELATAVWEATTILDRLGLYTTEVYLKIREGIIARQQEDMLELSTPVVTLAAGILALPLIGTLDSARTQVVMETLLQTIMETGSTIAIIDITGVPTVDTLVAQHLLKTVTAARLMGADCIISGIRPQIAQTIVHLGVELGDIATKATLAGAFKLALDRTGLSIVKTKPVVKS